MRARPINSRLRQLRYVPRAFKLAWTAAGRWTVAWLVLLAFQVALPILSVYLIRELVDEAARLLQEGWESPLLQSVLALTVALVVVQVASQLLSTILDWVQTAQSELVRDHISELIHEKATSLDLSFFDTPEYYDMLHRVRTEARQAPLSILQNFGSLASGALTLIGMAAILISYSPVLPFALVVSALPGLWVAVRYTRRYNRWRLENTSNERRTVYYDFMMTERVPASEVRLFSLAGYYQNVYQELRTQLRQARLRLTFDKAVTGLIATGIGLLVAGGALLWMGQRVLLGLASLGDLAAFYQIFQQGQTLMQVVTRNAGNIYQNVLFLEDLFTFFALEPKISETVLDSPPQRIPLGQSIRFENVSFRYPGSQKFALENFSMTVPAGKVVAIVGENGTGKTTLMKLLCRFYDPDGGRVMWDDTDLRDIPLQSLRREITMLFQAPLSYAESARHNIAAGDLSTPASMQKIEAAAVAAGADEIIRRLPKGYDTMLAKWFGGEELSIGQWQRVSLARALYRQASVIILDEPTSAMDAWAEMNWLNRVRDIARGVTLIMITHRFTTAMHADHIYVMRDNQIIEEGTHDSLLAQGKRYAESWHEQMRQPKIAPDIAPDATPENELTGK